MGCYLFYFCRPVFPDYLNYLDAHPETASFGKNNGELDLFLRGHGCLSVCALGTQRYLPNRSGPRRPAISGMAWAKDRPGKSQRKSAREVSKGLCRNAFPYEHKQSAQTNSVDLEIRLRRTPRLTAAQKNSKTQRAVADSRGMDARRVRANFRRGGTEAGICRRHTRRGLVALSSPDRLLDGRKDQRDSSGTLFRLRPGTHGAPDQTGNPKDAQGAGFLHAAGNTLDNNADRESRKGIALTVRSTPAKVVAKIPENSIGSRDQARHAKIHEPVPQIAEDFWNALRTQRRERFTPSREYGIGIPQTLLCHESLRHVANGKSPGSQTKIEIISGPHTVAGGRFYFKSSEVRWGVFVLRRSAAFFIRENYERFKI